MDSHSPKKHSLWLWILIIVAVGLFSLVFFKTSFTISQMTSWKNIGHPLPFSAPLPEKDPDRINILLLGVRGIDDPGEGKLLADAIVLCSIKKSTKQVALISLPRDIFIKPLGFEKGEKINFFYALGEEKKWGGGGLEYMKRVISEITNLYIDYAVSTNFQAFERVVDELGGLTIYLDQPFEEYLQWAQEGGKDTKYWVKKEIIQPSPDAATSTSREVWAFYLPAGENVLNGEAALYYVRSRYSTNDFDRMRRQQKVLMAIKDKALSLGVLANPVKIYNLLDILGDNVLTDMDLDDLKELVNLAQWFDQAHHRAFDPSKIKTKIFDTSPEGLLYYTFIDDIYVLLPVGGNFAKIQEECKNIFE